MIRPAAHHRICLVGSHAARGPAGYPSAHEALARRFERDGHRVLLTSRRERRLAKLADMCGTLLFRRADYDLVCIDTFSTAALFYARITARLGRLLGKRVVIVLHGGRLPELAERRPARLRGLLARADRVVAPSPFLAREVGRRLGVPVEVIGNPVACARYPSRVRERVRPRLLWLRAFREEYRPAIAVRAAALLQARHPDLRLVMAGPERDGSLERCRELARRAGLTEAIRFPGLVSKDEIGRLGAASDVFLNTSSVDNTPVSVLEAMAMGLCIVSTRVGGIPDLLEHGETALLVRPGDPAALAAAVGELLARPALARRLSAGARDAVRAQYDIDKVAPRWYRLFGDLCASAP